MEVKATVAAEEDSAAVIRIREQDLTLMVSVVVAVVM